MKTFEKYAIIILTQFNLGYTIIKTMI